MFLTRNEKIRIHAVGSLLLGHGADLAFGSDQRRDDDGHLGHLDGSPQRRLIAGMRDHRRDGRQVLGTGDEAFVFRVAGLSRC